ncbi:hypothetical protein D3C81_1744310 [compost metagenome]
MAARTCRLQAVPPSHIYGESRGSNPELKAVPALRRFVSRTDFVVVQGIFLANEDRGQVRHDHISPNLQRQFSAFGV